MISTCSNISLLSGRVIKLFKKSIFISGRLSRCAKEIDDSGISKLLLINVAFVVWFNFKFVLFNLEIVSFIVCFLAISLL